MVILTIAVSACGGGVANDTTPTLPQSGALITGSNSAQDITLGSQPVSAVIPAIANITGTVVFPAVPTPATLVLSASQTAPDGVALQSVRTAQSAGTLTLYIYVSMTPKTTVSLPSIPAMSYTFATSTPIAGKTFSYGISDPNTQGGQISFDTQGPGQINGASVSFPAVPTPLTLQAGHTYTFIVYATTTATSAKIFVANAGNDTVTAYNPDGSQTTPTIHAGIRSPNSLAVDSNGKIYVLNAGSKSLTTYTPDGSQTTPTITAGIDGPLAVAVDGHGKIYILNGNTYTVTTFNPDGSQTTPTITGLNQPSAMAVDLSGKVYITNFGYRTFDSGVTTYNADGSLAKPHISTPYLQPKFIALGATGKIYVDYEFPGIVATYNADGSVTTPAIQTSVPYALAVDAAGKIYQVNSSNNTVNIFGATGVASTPTITAGLNKPAAIAVH